MKNPRLLVVAAIAAVAVFVALATSQPKGQDSSSCGVYRDDKSVIINNETIDTEVVYTPQEKAQGLSGRPCIEADKGMLFVFDKPGRYPFWMKDMKFPIDIVWIGADKKVVGLDTNVEPSTYPDSFVAEKPAQYVLELQANRATDLGVELGTQVAF